LIAKQLQNTIYPMGFLQNILPGFLGQSAETGWAIGAKLVGPEVIEHWCTLIPDCQLSSKDFYTEVENILKAQQVPGLEITRVDLSEGGLLSDKREYLRMKRERLIFDVCAAPFGTNYFFSYRFVETPATVPFWQYLVVMFGVGVAFKFFQQWFGSYTGPVVLLLALVAGVLFLKNAVGVGLRDLDAALLNSPIVGALYGRYFRKDTYYRQDTRIMYQSVVADVVKKRIEDVTSAKGIKLLKTQSYSPIFGELYKSGSVAVKAVPPPA
jgi:hypothetical protein